MFRLFAWVVLAAAVAAASQDVPGWVRANQQQILREFTGFLSIPNIASDTANIRKNAAFLQQMLERRGVRTRLLEVEGAPPVVFGELPAAGASLTLAFYAHYDGQPVHPPDWRTGDPFRPVVEGNRLWGRSTSDDKAAILAMVAALDALKASGAKPQVNLKFLFEGEEEAGSAHLGAILRKHAGLLGADAWLICDGPVHQSGRQQVYFGARGVVGIHLTVYGATRELHSGHYGGWAPNAAMMLVHLLASMRDDSGRVTIRGFYEGAEPLSQAERDALAATPPVDDALRAELGLLRTEGAPRSLNDIINEPSLNVRGLRSADVGVQSRNVIPARATASIDIRLVKGIPPERAVSLLIEHVRAQGYYVTDREPDTALRRQHARIARIESDHGYRAAKTSMELPLMRRIVAAIERVRGPIVQAPTLGGSVPLYVFEDELKAPFLGLPIANHDNNQHSANENIQLANLWSGIETMAAVMSLR